MSKKGFTLVEIIAVIVLMGVIISIVVPTASSILKNARINSFKLATEELVDAVDLAITADNLSVESLNDFSVAQMFSKLGINETNSRNFKEITFSCISMSGTICTDYTVYAVGDSKYKNYTSFGYSNNLSATELSTEIGITMNYIYTLNNYIKNYSLSDGTYNVVDLSNVTRDSNIIGGTVIISNNKVIDYSIDFADETVVYDQEKRLPVIE